MDFIINEIVGPIIIGVSVGFFAPGGLFFLINTLLGRESSTIDGEGFGSIFWGLLAFGVIIFCGIDAILWRRDSVFISYYIRYLSANTLYSLHIV